MTNPSSLGIEFVTSDGQRFTKRIDATKHQMRLDALRTVADDLVATFGLDDTAAVNIVVHLAGKPDAIVKLLGRTLRTPKAGEPAGDGSSAAGDGDGDGDAADDTTAQEPAAAQTPAAAEATTEL